MGNCPKKVFFVCYDIDLLNKLLKSYDIFEYAYICHDKDVDSCSELLKPHYHCYIHFKVNNNRDSIMKLLNISNNNYLFQAAKSKKYCLRYLLHLDNLDKYQYEFDSIVSNITNLHDIIYSNDYKESLSSIIDYIDTFRPVYSDLVHFCIDNDLLSVFRSYQFIIKEYLKGIKNSDVCSHSSSNNVNK